MHIEKAVPSQLDQLLELYAQARQFMAGAGNPNQWVHGYPSETIVTQSIQNGTQYVCTDGSSILGTFFFTPEEEPTYREIFDGSWLNDRPYGVTHRICVAVHGRGVGAFCLQWCYEQCRNLRIDTHRDNRPMQALLAKCGFLPCGRIYLENGSERLAYQKA